MSMQVIEHIEVGSGGAASIEFTSISGSYTDLCLLISPRSSRTTNLADVTIVLSGDTGANYSYIRLYGDGSSAASTSASGATSLYTGTASSVYGTSNTFSSSLIYIPNYTSSSAKSISIDNVAERNATGAFQNLIAGLWDNSSAVTSIKIESPSFNLEQYSSATLFGITAGSSGGVTVS